MDKINDRAGRTPLHYAALEGDVNHVEELLQSGSDPDAGDHKGFTPLHFAAQQGSIEAARALLDAGATVDSINTYGNTPLGVAVFYSHGRGDLIQLLRSRGADPWHVNNAGQTPVGLARLIGNYDVAQFFADLDTE
jgi:ankyrin repeat protein